MLQTRPVAAGFLIGLAICAKPSLMALAPLCLLAGTHYRALVVVVIVSGMIGLVSMATFGMDTWRAWIAALGEFQTLVNGNPGLVRNMITPTGAAIQLGMEGTALAVVRAGFAVAGALIAWIGFRKPRPFEQRVTALVASGLFVSPYAMQYDAVLLLPAAIMVVVRTVSGSRWQLGRMSLLLMIFAGTAYTAPYATFALIALLMWFDFSVEPDSTSQERFASASKLPASGQYTPDGSS
jgi:hypothetical protein